MGDAAKTRDYLRGELEDLRNLLEDRRPDKADKAPAASGDGSDARAAQST